MIWLELLGALWIGVLAGVGVVGLLDGARSGEDGPAPRDLAGVVLELEYVYAGGATGALVLRETLDGLARRALEADEWGDVFPPTFDIPTAGAAALRLRTRPATELGDIYAGASVHVEKPTEPASVLRARRGDR